MNLIPNNVIPFDRDNKCYEELKDKNFAAIWFDKKKGSYGWLLHQLSPQEILYGLELLKSSLLEDYG